MGNIQLYTCGNKIYHIHKYKGQIKTIKKRGTLIHYSKSKQRRDFE